MTLFCDIYCLHKLQKMSGNKIVAGYIPLFVASKTNNLTLKKYQFHAFKLGFRSCKWTIFGIHVIFCANVEKWCPLMLWTMIALIHKILACNIPVNVKVNVIVNVQHRLHILLCWCQWNGNTRASFATFFKNLHLTKMCLS